MVDRVGPEKQKPNVLIFDSARLQADEAPRGIATFRAKTLLLFHDLICRKPPVSCYPEGVAVDVAQVVELQIVILAVAGSSPVIHPTSFPLLF